MTRYNDWIFFCFSLGVIFGESSPSQSYDQRSYETESPSGGIEENSNPQDRISTFSDLGSEGDGEDEEERPARRQGIIDPEVADQLEGNGWLDVIPGTPGKDYPNYERIPETSFTCDDKTPGGYYADIEARCQVFHVCNTGGEKSSFVCPSGSIFNQKYFVCDWWYDFECDDATDLYSLNDKINRGGTGSGPGGPGRIEQSVDYPSDNQDFHQGELQNGGNFVADGYDLSLAGTGEGGPGYARNGNSKGYQSNVNDENDKEKQNERNQSQARGSRRKNVNDRKIVQSQKVDYSLSEVVNDERKFENGNKKQERTNERSNESGESPKDFTPGFSKNHEQELSAISLDTKTRSGENLRKQNSAAGSSRVNYQGGFVNANSNDAMKSNNFRSGYWNGERAEQLNEFNDYGNNHSDHPAQNTPNTESSNNHPRQNTQNYENQNGFGEKTSTEPRNFYLRPKNAGNNHHQGSSSPELNTREFLTTDNGKDDRRNNSDERINDDRKFNSDKNSSPNSSGSNNNEYRSPSVIREGTRSTNIRWRQRTSEGLQEGLGNGYPSPGRTRELPGSDAIASAITLAGRVYDKGGQRSLNSQQKTSSGTRSPGELTDLRLVTDSQNVNLDRLHNQKLRRSDFREDNLAPEIVVDSYDSRSSKTVRNYATPITPSLRNENYQKRDDLQHHRNFAKNYGNDYLIGIVPGAEDRENGTSGSSSNQQRRFLPIL